MHGIHERYLKMLPILVYQKYVIINILYTDMQNLSSELEIFQNYLEFFKIKNKFSNLNSMCFLVLQFFS